MTNIEKYLIEHGFAEKERYPVGTVTYMTKDESGFYMAAFEDHLKWAIRLRDELNAVEDPWGEVE